MSEERSKISLRSGPKRKGRREISTPRQISSPILQDEARRSGTGGTVEPAPRPRLRQALTNGGQTRQTSDFVRQRFSRYNNIPPSFDTPLPPMPSMPTKERRLPPSRGGAAPVVDIKALRDPHLVPDQFVSAALSEATEDQIHEFEESLRKVKGRAAADLQQSLKQNRKQFIWLSKETEKLKEEMRTLCNLIAELKVNTTALRGASMKGDEAATTMAVRTAGSLSKGDKRSSVADRSALWNSQMQALYKNIEGSQKFLPNAAGRHVVQDAGPWIELDSATYKSRRAMQIFLLNDHLLIASRKKRKADSPAADARNPLVKLVADRCWPLLDVEVTDLSASSEESTGGKNKLADAIMVRGDSQETLIYRTEKSQEQEKTTLLLNVRKAVEELRKNLQSEIEANNRTRETINYFASRDPSLLQKTELLETLSDIKDMLVEVDGKQQNLRWVESQMDELDISIALQRFEPAVALVEKLKGLASSLRSNVVAHDFINFKVEERSSRLASIITRELEATHNEQGRTQLNVGWLTRLGFEDRAREAYLAARSGIIRKRARQCIFQGDLHMYIWQVSFVYFTLIHNTVQCFQSCFPSPIMSACVKWAKEKVDVFNELLARQLSISERGGQVWTQCLERAREHAQKLSRVGLNFRSLVGRGLESGGGGGSGSGTGVGLGLD